MAYSKETQGAIIDLFHQEIAAWERGKAWVSNRVAFDMNEVINRSIKNYFGVFDTPIDKATKREKIFIPLTEWTTEAIVKNIDIDTADIKVRAQRPDRYGSASILRSILKWNLQRLQFGELLNELLRDVTIMGTAIVKIQKGLDNKTGKQAIKINSVHPLNFIIDPSARDIQEAVAVYERNVLTIDQAKQMPWDNLDKLQGRTDIDPIRFTDANILWNKNAPRHGAPSVEVYERWGLFPKSFLTENQADADTWINGVIIISGLYTNPVIHTTQEVKNVWKPYEEARFKRVPGRWHGRGVGEMLIGIQTYLNELINVRIASNRIRHLGLWNIRKGSGITPEMLAGLVASTGITTPRPGDIAPLPVPELPATAYKDEDQVNSWTERVTGYSRMEDVNASQPATTSVLQDRASRTTASLRQEDFGFFLERVLERHYIPKLLKTLTPGDLINITGDPKELQVLDDAVITNFLNKEIIAFHETHGVYPTPDDVNKARTRAEQNFRKFGDARWIEIQNDILDPTFSTEIFITDEAVDRAIMIRELNNALSTIAQLAPVFPELRDEISPSKVFKETLDLIGIGGDRFTPDKTTGKQDAAAAALQAQAQQGTVTKFNNQSRLESLAQTLTPEGTGRAATASL